VLYVLEILALEHLGSVLTAEGGFVLTTNARPAVNVGSAIPAESSIFFN